VIELEKQIAILERREDAESYAEELESLRTSRTGLLAKIYGNLSPWDIVRVARHAQRPQASDYIEMMCRDFCELHGDRHFGDDPAIITGGYRKALGKMKLAEKFGLPVVTLIDTPGAYPGIKAEERGQAQAIAVNLFEMSRLRTPVVCVVIGEGGSGGALGIGVGDRVAMLEYAWYSVISPEGCAAILWKEANEKTNCAAADALALTASHNLANGLVDAVIEEPVGGAHRDPTVVAKAVEAWIVDRIRELKRSKPETLVQRRYEKLRKTGAVAWKTPPGEDPITR